MCLAVPAEVVALLGSEQARVSVGGIQKKISVSFVENLAVGDFVLIHVGHALAKIDAEEAQKTLLFFEELYGKENLRAELDGEPE